MPPVPKAFVLTCALLISVVPAQARHNKPNPAFAIQSLDKQHMLQDHFVILKTVRAIPKSVLSRLLGKYPEDGMADVAQPYEHTDAPPPGPRLPLRGLVLAALSPKYCIVVDNYGGYGEGTEVSLYRLSAMPADLVWKANWRDASGRFDLPHLQNDVANELNDTYKDRDDINKCHLLEIRPEDYSHEPARLAAPLPSKKF